MRRGLTVGWLVALAACGGFEVVDPGASGGSAPASGATAASCAVGAELTGTAYDIRKSRFAFGSAPVQTLDGTLTRFTGSQGVVAIEATGYTLGVLNGGVAEANVADWSADSAALSTHVQSYFADMGVATCQIAGPHVLGGSGGRTVSLDRAIDGIRVSESLAYARIDLHDLSTEEGFFWPTVPAQVVAAARALRDQLAAPAALAAFKARLPSNAQGNGVVQIHHSSGLVISPFAAVASYDVVSTLSDLGSPNTLSFSADGSARRAASVTGAAVSLSRWRFRR